MARVMALLRDAALVVATALVLAAAVAGFGSAKARSTLRHGLQLGRVKLVSTAAGRPALTPSCTCRLG